MALLVRPCAASRSTSSSRSESGSTCSVAPAGLPVLICANTLPATAGSSTFPPPATALTARTISSASAFFRMYPSAPARSKRKDVRIVLVGRQDQHPDAG